MPDNEERPNETGTGRDRPAVPRRRPPVQSSDAWSAPLGRRSVVLAIPIFAGALLAFVGHLIRRVHASRACVLYNAGCGKHDVVVVLGVVLLLAGVALVIAGVVHVFLIGMQDATGVPRDQ
jgi:hypothetical protein